MSKTIYIGGRLESKEKGNVVAGANAILDDTKGKKQNVINKETDDELLRLEQSKQDNLTFDNAPTEDSTNPVTSGGVYTAEKALSDAIEAILLLIPSAATALNKLVDTNTMNSSISTATATFRGTYNAVSDLGLTYQATHAQIEAALDALGLTADNNDYAFVQVPVSDQSQDIAKTERYKNNGTNWQYEYDLNTSGFTSQQWAAINSGITVALVTKLTDLPTAAALQLALNAKQDTLTFDTEPTALSQNPVTSGGIYTAIQAIATALSDYSTTTDGRLNVLEGLIPPEAASNNKLTDKAYVDGLIRAITELIPAEATTSNQLADKAYVLASILAATPAFKGQFTTLAELQAVASPKDGDLGIVRTKDSDGMDVFTVYQYLNNAWNVFYSLSYHPQTKPATTGTTGDYPYNGMGRVELAKNMVNTGTELAPVYENQLTQDMFYKGAVGSRTPNTNTIFVIRYDYVLAENITIPDNCVLEFEGGSISGSYTLTGANTGIKAGLVKMFDTTTTLAGTWNVAEAYPEWFDISDAAKTRDAIQKAVNIADRIVLSGDYNVQNSVYNPNEDMYAQRQLIIAGAVTEDYITIGSGKTIEITGKVKATSPLTDLFRVVGDNTLFCGGGIIEGCGVVNDWNTGSDYSIHENLEWRQWGASLIRVYGNSNKVSNLRLYHPTTYGVYIKHSTTVSEYFSNNAVVDCIIGGGLASHTPTQTIDGYVQSYTVLMGVYSECSETLVKNNRFVPYEGKHIYTALYATYQDTPIPYVFEGNYVADTLEHAVYSYADNGIIDGNYILDTESVMLQCFCRKTKVLNNKMERTEAKINVGGVIGETGGVVVCYDDNVISGNTIINCTKYAISVNDSYISRDVDIINNRIEGNTILMYYGYNEEVSPIRIEATSKNVTDCVITKNNIVGTHLSTYAYTGAIIISNPSAGGTYNNKVIQNIIISKNFIKNVPQSAIILDGGTVESPVYKNITISDNSFIDCCNHANTSTPAVFVRNAVFVNFVGNNADYTENAVKSAGLLQTADNVDKLYVFNNTLPIRGDYGASIGIAAPAKALIKDNYIRGRQNGLLTIASGTTFTQVTDAAIFYNNGSGNLIGAVKVNPLNTAAAELLKSEHYPIFDYPSGWYGNFTIKTNDATAVSADCLFEWEIVYIGV